MIMMMKGFNCDGKVLKKILRAHFRHILSRRSLLPDTTLCPSGLQSTVYTSSPCPGKSVCSFFVSIDHSLRVESAEPDTKSRLSAAQETFQGAKLGNVLFNWQSQVA